MISLFRNTGSHSPEWWLSKSGQVAQSEPEYSSTLIEGIAVAMGFNPEGGTVNFNFSTNDSHSDLHEYLTVSRGYRKHRDGFFLRAESFYNVASNIDELDEEPSFGPKLITNYGGISLHKQSHGESFMALVEHRFRGNGLYILDAPEKMVEELLR